MVATDPKNTGLLVSDQKLFRFFEQDEKQDKLADVQCLTFSFFFLMTPVSQNVDVRS